MSTAFKSLLSRIFILILFSPFGNNFIFSLISSIITYLESHWYAESLKKWKLWEMKNYNVSSTVTVSEEREAISGKQWLPEMVTMVMVTRPSLVSNGFTRDADRENWTESELLNFRYGKKKSGYTGVSISTGKEVNLSQDEASEWWPEIPTEKLRPAIHYEACLTRLNIE